MVNKYISGSGSPHRIPQEELEEGNFTNSDTWRMAVWFELNPAIKRFVRQTSYYLGAPEIKRLCYKWWEDTNAPSGICLESVDWKEVNSLWNNQSKRVFAETQKLLDHHAFKKWYEC